MKKLLSSLVAFCLSFSFVASAMEEQEMLTREIVEDTISQIFYLDVVEIHAVEEDDKAFFMVCCNTPCEEVKTQEWVLDGTANGEFSITEVAEVLQRMATDFEAIGVLYNKEALETWLSQN